MTKVKVINHNGRSVHTITNVTKIDYPEDGRKLVHHDKECPTCHHLSKWTHQVPADYQIEVVEC